MGPGTEIVKTMLVGLLPKLTSLGAGLESLVP